MNIAAFGNAVFALAVFAAFASPALGASVTFVAPANASNGASSVSTADAYTANLGYAFKTGPSGLFDIDWVKLEMNNGASAGVSGSFKIAIHNTDNGTPYSAVAGSTAYATDTVSFTTPVTTNTNFELNLTSVQLPNITGYQLLPDTAYALFVYDSFSSNLALRRTHGFANGTTNDNYTVSSSFTMLDTFRNNVPNYTNAANSYPTFAISFGATEAIPEPSTLALLSIFVGGGLFRRRRTRD